MDEKKFDDMMDQWAEHEQSAAPHLRPTREMYTMLKARRQSFWFPAVARWATVGVAAAIIVVVAILHPSLVPVPLFQEEKVSHKEGDNGRWEETRSVTRRTVVIGQEEQEPPGRPEKMDQLTESTGPSEGAPPPAADLQPAPMHDETATAGDQPQMVATQLEAPAESQSPEPMPGIARGRMKGGPPPDEERFDADRQEGLETEVKKAPDDVFSFRNARFRDEGGMDVKAEYTPLPSPSLSSPSEAVSGSEPESMDSMQPEMSRTVPESELPEVLTAPASPKICALQTAAEKTIGDKTFRVYEEVWIDTAYDEAQERLVIQRDSQAYHDLLDLLPDIQMYTEAGAPHILVSLGKAAIEINDAGKTQLTERDVQLLKSLQTSP